MSENNSFWLGILDKDIDIRRQDVATYGKAMTYSTTIILTVIASFIALINNHSLALEDAFVVNLFYSSIAWIFMVFGSIIMFFPHTERTALIRFLKGAQQTHQSISPEEIVMGLFFLISELSCLVSFLYIYFGDVEGTYRILYLIGLGYLAICYVSMFAMMFKKTLFRKTLAVNLRTYYITKKKGNGKFGTVIKLILIMQPIFVIIMGLFILIYTWTKFPYEQYFVAAASIFAVGVLIIYDFSSFANHIKSRNLADELRDLRYYVIKCNPEEEQIKKVYEEICDYLSVEEIEDINESVIEPSSRKPMKDEKMRTEE